MSIGDTVIMYDPAGRTYHFGTINGPCVPSTNDVDITYRRNVSWDKSVSRDRLSATSKNSLGSIQTIFSVNETVFADLNQTTATSHIGDSPSFDDEMNEEEALAATYENGIELIKDHVQELDS